MGFVNLHPPLALKFSVVVMGFTAVASQVLIIRELIVIFHGNELFIGIIFAYWLIFQAIGSYYISKKSDLIFNYTLFFSLMQFIVGFLCFLILLLIRSIRYLLGISTGEILGIHHVLLISFFALMPFTLMGALFPIACRNFRDFFVKENYPARVYIFESVGSFIAGIAFIFYFTYYLSSIELSFIILALNLTAVILYIQSRNSSKTIKYLSALTLLIAILILITPASTKLNLLSIKLLWYEHTLVESRNSPYSNIAIVKKEDQYTLFLNGSPFSVMPYPEISLEEFAHLSILFHEDPKDILVIGSGFEGFLMEINKHQVNKIDYVEPDPVLIESLQKLLKYEQEKNLKDFRINTHLTEGRLFLKNTSYLYDVIIINLSIPSTLQLNRFYSVEFFQLVKRKLRNNGILVTKLPGSELFLSENLRKLNSILYETLNFVFPYVRVLVGEQNIFIASKDNSILNLNQEKLIERVNSRKIISNFINEWYIRYKMDNLRFQEIERTIISANEKQINSDYHPRAVYETILYLNSALNPYVISIFNFLKELKIYHCLLFILFVFTILLIFQRKKKEIFLPYAIITTGFMSMLISIFMILLFQINFGNIYKYIGILTSIFMLGSALGSYLGVKISKNYFIKVEIGILILLILLYFFVSYSTNSYKTLIIIFSAMALNGLLTGMEFPLAIILANHSKSKSSLAGKFYALDLFGAFIGAVLPAAILIPIIGIKDTLLITLTIKLTSFILTLGYFLNRKN